jgi:hypothetical protein
MMTKVNIQHCYFYSIVDQRSNEIWSNNLDSMIPTVYGSKKPYGAGSRDSLYHIIVVNIKNN